MEIANTKQQREPPAPAATESQMQEINADCDTVSSTLKTEETDVEDEINALLNSVPQIANHFIISRKIGEGAFSCVYQASLRHYPEVCEQFALKHILPTTHPSRIENELRCLLKLGGQDNVMGVKLCLRNRDHVVIVMEHFPHEKFQSYLALMSVSECREYMRNLLIALRRVHKYNVIHRDVKPSNFLYDRYTKRYALVDFGLASGNFLIDRDGEKIGRRSKGAGVIKFPSPPSSAGTSKKASRVPLSPSKANITTGKKFSPTGCSARTSPSIPLPGRSNKPGTFCIPTSSTKAFLEKSGHCGCLGKPLICSICVARKNQLAPRAGTAGFRAPEVLMKSASQDTGVDIWSAGTIFLSLLSGRYPFFRAQDDLGHLAQIISVVGSMACIQAGGTFGKSLVLSESIPPVDLRSTCLKLRSSQMTACLQSGNELTELVHDWSNISPHAFDILNKMLNPNPCTRISAEEALKHPFFAETNS